MKRQQITFGERASLLFPTSKPHRGYCSFMQEEKCEYKETNIKIQHVGRWKSILSKKGITCDVPPRGKEKLYYAVSQLPYCEKCNKLLADYEETERMDADGVKTVFCTWGHWYYEKLEWKPLDVRAIPEIVLEEHRLREDESDDGKKSHYLHHLDEEQLLPTLRALVPRKRKREDDTGYQTIKCIPWHKLIAEKQWNEDIQRARNFGREIPENENLQEDLLINDTFSHAVSLGEVCKKQDWFGFIHIFCSLLNRLIIDEVHLEGFPCRMLSWKGKMHAYFHMGSSQQTSQWLSLLPPFSEKTHESRLIVIFGVVCTETKIFRNEERGPLLPNDDLVILLIDRLEQQYWQVSKSAECIYAPIILPGVPEEKWDAKEIKSITEDKHEYLHFVLLFLMNWNVTQRERVGSQQYNDQAAPSLFTSLYKMMHPVSSVKSFYRYQKKIAQKKWSCLELDEEEIKWVQSDTIGIGAFDSVFKTVWSNETVALKISHCRIIHHVNWVEYWQRCLREAEIQQLVHTKWFPEQVPQVKGFHFVVAEDSSHVPYGVFLDKELKFFRVMAIAYYEGARTLHDYCSDLAAQRKRWPDMLDVKRRAQLLEELVTFVDTLASNGICHGDITATNILVVQSHLRFIDFGLSYLYDTPVTMPEWLNYQEALISCGTLALFQAGQAPKNMDIFKLGILVMSLSILWIPKLPSTLSFGKVSAKNPSNFEEDLCAVRKIFLWVKSMCLATLTSNSTWSSTAKKMATWIPAWKKAVSLNMSTDKNPLAQLLIPISIIVQALMIRLVKSVYHFYCPKAQKENLCGFLKEKSPKHSWVGLFFVKEYESFKATIRWLYKHKVKKMSEDMKKWEPFYSNREYGKHFWKFMCICMQWEDDEDTSQKLVKSEFIKGNFVSS